MKWVLNSEIRQAILFLFGLAGITEQIVVAAMGGPSPDTKAMVTFGIFALGAPTARGIIAAWRGLEINDDNIQGNDVEP